ncbi:hypothetical protein [Citricoccus muralis]|uniref:Uncharacterized protein n=1 Tax=Citricoccus muralis TaxID=169134 RepID=A0ABY8H512_9MICC|nr:hypothetical protein [Citricoccus muralis]WFP15737.1 hypothetical protein P8192_10050 [Citricoccus muralis]
MSTQRREPREMLKRIIVIALAYFGGTRGRGDRSGGHSAHRRPVLHRFGHVQWYYDGHADRRIQLKPAVGRLVRLHRRRTVRRDPDVDECGSAAADRDGGTAERLPADLRRRHRAGVLPELRAFHRAGEQRVPGAGLVGNSTPEAEELGEFVGSEVYVELEETTGMEIPVEVQEQLGQQLAEQELPDWAEQSWQPCARLTGRAAGGAAV